MHHSSTNTKIPKRTMKMRESECSGGALHGLGWATAHPEKLKNQQL